ncbi:TIGR03086 family metal-binding protein [Actinophytocola gossypii]|uniref:TIGR03086 family protein n=1 Tax=Actinophytocola gossypii TaxID=2812003 RepID=A0ABT2J434_9PSEU|nr:TIGR03086 family metal-binding protein [Actinophytocola gossypii]MCT2582605.1 TIGR03086 family protein [Actinophytocola gossypii]
MDVMELDRRARAATGAIIDRVPDALLDAPTPCDSWTIRQIVEHMVDNNRAFVSAHKDSTVDIGHDFAETGQAVDDLFADPAVRERTFTLAGVDVDWRGAVAVHFADVLVHGWDIGRAAGLDVTIDDDLAAAALRVTSRFPDSVRGPDRGFDHPRPVRDDAPVWIRLLAFLGRDPEWTRRAE